MIQVSLVFLTDPIGRQPLDRTLLVYICVMLLPMALQFLTVTSIEERFAFAGIVGIAIVCIISSALRAPLWAISPIGDGPRYFFLPFAMYAWLMVWLIGFGGFPRVISILILLACAPISAQYFQRGQLPNADWQAMAKKCLIDGASMPIQYDGINITEYAEYLNSHYTAEICRSADDMALW